MATPADGKRPYETPTLTTHGPIEEMTRGIAGWTGEFLGGDQGGWTPPSGGSGGSGPSGGGLLS